MSDLEFTLICVPAVVVPLAALAYYTKHYLNCAALIYVVIPVVALVTCISKIVWGIK